MTPKNLSAALFTAALLSGRKDLNARLRSQIISCVSPFDIFSRRHSLDGLTDAFHRAGCTFSPRMLTANKLWETAETATEWLQRGVFVVARDDFQAPGSALHDLPPIFFAKGDPSSLGLTGTAILNSRHSRQVTAEDYWIKNTKEQVTSAMRSGAAIVSSYGNLSYSLVSCLAKGFPLISVCDGILPFMDSVPKAEQFLSAYGDLFNTETTLFISPFPPGPLPTRATRLAERDHLVAALSSVLMIGEVRPAGNMAAILEIASKRKVKIVDSLFNKACPGKKDDAKDVVINRRARQSNLRRSSREKQKGQPARWPEFSEFASKSCYLVHYTRSCPGPWPGQTMAQYCRSLIDASEGSSHKAFDTLWRVLEEKLIRGGNRLTRGPEHVVSLTECLPEEISTIVRWRPGLIRWNFEPYGIAIRKEELIRLGARQVIYGADETLRKLPESEKYLFQKQKAEQDWRSEKEWRLPGDLLLTLISREDLVVIVPNFEEAKIIESRFGYKVASAETAEEQGHPPSDVGGKCTTIDSEHGTSHGI